MDATSTIGGISSVLLIGLLVAAIKYTGKVDSKWYPILSMFMGALVGVAWAYAGAFAYVAGISGGMVLGAGTSGFYDAITGKITTDATTSNTTTSTTA